MTTDTYVLWKKGKEYQRSNGFLNVLPLCQRFKEGNQWPIGNEQTECLPRPVFNICSKFVFTKKAMVVRDISVPECPFKTIDQVMLNDNCLEDAATLGTGIIHYYWDSEQNSLMGEVIDPLAVIFGNPIEKDIQRQPYIIIESFVPNDKADTADLVRINGYNYQRVLTKYFKKNNQVYYERCTSNKILQKATSMRDGFNLYPLVMFIWDNRKSSIYGIGEVEPIIPTQDIINHFYALNMLAVQDTAWSKWVVKAGALEQNITNEPGEIIVDNTEGNDIGVHKISGDGIPSGIMAFITDIKEFIQYTSGIPDVITGENNKNLSAAAYSAMEEQAKIPIQNKQNKLIKMLSDAQRIWELFYRYYGINV